MPVAYRNVVDDVQIVIFPSLFDLTLALSTRETFHFLRGKRRFSRRKRRFEGDIKSSSTVKSILSLYNLDIVCLSYSHNHNLHDVRRPNLPGVQPRRHPKHGRKGRLRLDSFPSTFSVHPVPRCSPFDTPSDHQPDRQHVFEV